MGEHDLNQTVYTTLSYYGGLSSVPATDAYGNQGGLGAFDIAALQALYGVNMATATGDNVYALPTQNARGTGWSCIWDAGGNDTISGEASVAAVTIDLRAATLISHDPHAGGYISQQHNIAGGFTIANKVVIENATGGSGHDTLVGNDAANVLTGNGGDDMLMGKGGADTMYGGAGEDTYIVDNAGDRAIEASANGGIDDVQTTVSHTLSAYIEYLTARGSSAITLTGNAQNNQILGNDSANKINGGAGKDVLTGSAGKDIFVFNASLKAADVDKITDFRSVDDTIYLENAIFKKLKTGKLPASAFWIGSKAHDASDRIIYQKSAGKVFFDVDGTGSSKAVLFATLKPGVGLSAADFIVI
jgi:serralysin